jgi:cytochrome c553
MFASRFSSLRLAAFAAFSLAVAPFVYAQDRSEQPTVSDRFCTTCHGVDGRGNEGVQAPRLAGMEPWYLKRQLILFKEGIRGAHPEDYQGQEMQPMVESFSEERLDEIVRWVKTWQYRPAEITITGDAERGQMLYRSCASCHGANAEGKEAMNAPALAGQNDWYLLTQLKNFKAGYRGTDPQDTFGAQMQAMAQSLPDEKAMLDVVSYINSLSREQ